MSRGGTTLYVTGFSHGTRARDLAYEFERYGRLVRCDIPAPRSASSRLSFAFVEYEDRRDADDAYYEMHNKRLGRDDILKIEWARTPPSASWRFDSGRDRDRRRSPASGSGRRRSPSPRRSTRDYSPRKDDRSDRHDDRDRDRRERRGTRDRSRSPERYKGSPSPDGKRDKRELTPRAHSDRDSKEERDDRDRHENGADADDRKPADTPPPQNEDLDITE